MSFLKIFQESNIILTEGAIVERLKCEFGAKMDQFINHAGFIYEPKMLDFLYRQYITIAQKFDLPIMIMTPTRKVNAESLIQSSFKDKTLIGDSCKFLNRIKNEYNDYSQKILIGGLLGCKGDAYSGDKIMEPEEAYLFHKNQTFQFLNENVDYLFARIMPEINEAKGMAKAMAETNIPYIISFMVRKDGRLMDGTLLCDAIETIDKEVFPKPVCYMANCIHPTNLIEALQHEKNRNSPFLSRFSGIQSNASILSPEELNNCGVLHQDDFSNIINEMCVLKTQFNFKIFGGCCGTNNEFIKSLSEKIISL